MPSISDPQPIPVYIKDGAYIAAILLIWGVLAAFFRYGVGDIGLPFEQLWLQMANLLAVTGLLNALLYLLYRFADYWHRSV